MKDKIGSIFSKLKEMRKDKKGRAIIELCFYFIFFLFIIIFISISNRSNYKIEDNNISSFINVINDNYEYDIKIKYNDIDYIYNGKILGNNGNIIKKDNDEENNYVIINKKYYKLDDNDNYLLVDKEEVYSLIDYDYLDINNIKYYINNSIKDNDIYKVKLNNGNYFTIKIDENNYNIVIDYTNLFKLEDSTINNVIVDITYKNINKIMSLD